MDATYLEIPATGSAGIPSLRSTTQEVDRAQLGALLAQAQQVEAQVAEAVATMHDAWNGFVLAGGGGSDSKSAVGQPHPVASDRLNAIASSLTGIGNYCHMLHAVAQDVRSRT